MRIEKVAEFHHFEVNITFHVTQKTPDVEAPAFFDIFSNLHQVMCSYLAGLRLIDSNISTTALDLFKV